MLGARRERECPSIVVPVVTVCSVQPLPRARKCTFGVGAQHREGGASEEADTLMRVSPGILAGASSRGWETKTKFGSEFHVKAMQLTRAAVKKREEENGFAKTFEWF